MWDVDADSLLGSQAILDPYGPVFDGYYGDIIGKEFGCNRLKNELSNLKIAYTPMHGVGLHYMQHAFQLAGLKVSFNNRESLDSRFFLLLRMMY